MKRKPIRRGAYLVRHVPRAVLERPIPAEAQRIIDAYHASVAREAMKRLREEP